MEETPQPQPRNVTRDRIVWAVIVLAAVAFFISSLPQSSSGTEVTLARIIDDARAGRIDTLDVSGRVRCRSSAGKRGEA